MNFDAMSSTEVKAWIYDQLITIKMTQDLVSKAEQIWPEKAKLEAIKKEEESKGGDLK